MTENRKVGHRGRDSKLGQQVLPWLDSSPSSMTLNFTVIYEDHVVQQGGQCPCLGSSYESPQLLWSPVTKALGELLISLIQMEVTTRKRMQTKSRKSKKEYIRKHYCCGANPSYGCPFPSAYLCSFFCLKCSYCVIDFLDMFLKAFWIGQLVTA